MDVRQQVAGVGPVYAPQSQTQTPSTFLSKTHFITPFPSEPSSEPHGTALERKTTDTLHTFVEELGTRAPCSSTLSCRQKIGSTLQERGLEREVHRRRGPVVVGLGPGWVWAWRGLILTCACSRHFGHLRPSLLAFFFRTVFYSRGCPFPDWSLPLAVSSLQWEQVRHF